MAQWLGRAILALLLATAGPVVAQQYDGLDNDGDGEVDEADEATGSGGGTGNLEVACASSARPDVCLTYYQFYCQTYGFPMACAMASLGANCNGGDPGQCQYFAGILQANTACAIGDQNACAYLSQQPILQQ